MSSTISKCVEVEVDSHGDDHRSNEGCGWLCSVRLQRITAEPQCELGLTRIHPGLLVGGPPRLGSCDAQAAASTKIECSSGQHPLKTTPRTLTLPVAPPLPDLLPPSGPPYRGSVHQLPPPPASSLPRTSLREAQFMVRRLGLVVPELGLGSLVSPSYVYRPRQPACTQLLLSISLYLYTILRHI